MVCLNHDAAVSVSTSAWQSQHRAARRRAMGVRACAARADAVARRRFPGAPLPVPSAVTGSGKWLLLLLPILRIQLNFLRRQAPIA